MTKRQKKRYLKKVADKKSRVKTFGEVFTPTPLVNEILDIENFIDRCHDIEIKTAWGIALTKGLKENMVIVSTHLLTA